MAIETYERSWARDPANGGYYSLWVTEDTHPNNGQISLTEAHLCGYRTEGPATSYAPIPGTERGADTNYRVWRQSSGKVLLDSSDGTGGATPVEGGTKESWTGLNIRIDNDQYAHTTW